MATTRFERSDKREFGVYSINEGKFLNLNCIDSVFDAEQMEFLTYEDYEIPTMGLFTVEECDRYIIHKENRDNYKVINCKSPSYLVNFELMVYKKQRYEKIQEESKRALKQQEENFKSQIKNTKQNYFKALQDWKEKTEIVNRSGGDFGKILSEKPQINDFNLVISDFTFEEQTNLKSKYGFVTS